MAHNCGKVALQSEVRVRMPIERLGGTPKKNGEPHRVIQTTVGRLIFSEILPDSISYFDPDLPFANEVMGNKRLQQIVAMCHKQAGPEKTAQVLDLMKDLGFEYAKRGGISICMDDMKIPKSKTKILDLAKKDPLCDVITIVLGGETPFFR